MKIVNADGLMAPSVDNSGLRRLAIRGAGVTVLSSGVGLAIQMIATVVLARLLAPSDFGVVAMVTTFSLLLASFGLNGFTEAVVQSEEINCFVASNLFWINIGGGLLLTVGFAAAGSLLARFYQNAVVVHVAMGVSLAIFFTSTSVLHLALLKRDMRFSAVSSINIVAQAVSVVVSILLAWGGWGYWALVAGVIAQPLSTTIGAWILCRWIPSLPRRAAGTASMVRFALHVYGRFGVNYFARNTDNLLVGWRFNAQALGFYKKAYDLFALSASQLVSPLTVVAVSGLSRLNRDSVQYRRYFLRSVGVMAFVGMGLGADLTLVGKDVIRLLLGPQWEESGRVFTFFGPGIGVMLLYGMHGWVHLSIGTVDRWFRWGMIEFAFTVLLFVLGMRWGPVGIASAWTASFWILTIPAFWYAGRPIRLGVAPVLTAVWKYVVGSILAGCASAVMIRSVPSLISLPDAVAALVRIVTVSLVFVALYLGAVILLHWGCAPIHQLTGILRETLKRGGRLETSPVIAAVSRAGWAEGFALTRGGK